MVKLPYYVQNLKIILLKLLIITKKVQRQTKSSTYVINNYRLTLSLECFDSYFDKKGQNFRHGIITARRQNNSKIISKRSVSPFPVLTHIHTRPA